MALKIKVLMGVNNFVIDISKDSIIKRRCLSRECFQTQFLVCVWIHVRFKYIYIYIYIYIFQNGKVHEVICIFRIYLVSLFSHTCMFPAYCFRQRTYMAQGVVNGILNETWTHSCLQLDGFQLVMGFYGCFLCV